MARYINQTLTFKNRQFVVLGVHARFDMFLVQEVGRNFKTLIAFDEIVTAE